ncbi:MAG: macro domain-containing protein [Nitrospinota bacterium]
MEVTINQSQLILEQGDITESDAQAIVNAANSDLILGAGVAGAIRSKGGPEIQKECDKIGHCSVGDAVITPAGNLKCKFVIHAVGPRWGEGDETNKLKSALINSLKRAEENQITSIAFPALSTGIFGFPLELAAETLLHAAINYLAQNTSIKSVAFVLFDSNSFNVFKDKLGQIKK